MYQHLVMKVKPKCNAGHENYKKRILLFAGAILCEWFT